MVIRLILLIILIEGCVTSGTRQEDRWYCPKPKLNGAVTKQELESFQQGCEKYYGPKSCVLEVTPIPTEQHFNVVCLDMRTPREWILPNRSK